MSRLLLAALAGACLLATQAFAAEAPVTVSLKPFNVTIRVFDPAEGQSGGVVYVLPVDSPDAEHAVASTMANAASFTAKVRDGKPLPVAFTCLKVEPR